MIKQCLHENSNRAKKQSKIKSDQVYCANILFAFYKVQYTVNTFLIKNDGGKKMNACSFIIFLFYSKIISVSVIMEDQYRK